MTRTIRGIRDSINQGEILGRTDAGSGPPHPIKLVSALKLIGGQQRVLTLSFAGDMTVNRQGNAVVAGLQGIPVQSGTPNDGDVLTYVAADNKWEPMAAGSGSGTVTTTGSPASGNLSKFSGTTSITNADLTGDVTTSGALATTLATVNSNVGTFGDATHVARVTVNAKGLVTGASSVAITGGGGGGGPLTFPAQGRPTLVTGTPIMTSSVTGQTTVYFTPYKGSYIPIYDGTSWTPTQFTEMSQPTTDTTKSPAACAANSNYDLFVWSDSGTLRCTRGPLWSSDTSRGTGAGTTELVTQDGVLINANDITNGPAAKRGVYVGTIRTNGSSTIDYILGGAGAAGGERTILGLWSYYNRVLVKLVNFDNTTSWTYTTGTFRPKNNSTANEISFVVGLSEDMLQATNVQQETNSTAAIAASITIGLNSTTAGASASSVGRSAAPTANASNIFTCFYADIAPLGFNFLCPLEESNATGTATWFGSSGIGTKSLFFATIPA